jgi:Zn-dependent peptidase ImmA (M78 family)
MTVTKRWTEEEEQYLREHFKKMTNTELAKKFGVTKISIQRKLSRLGLIRQQQKKWTTEEENYLIEHYETLSDHDLAEYFEVTVVSIKRKLNRLKLKRKKGKKNEKISAFDKGSSLSSKDDKKVGFKDDKKDKKIKSSEKDIKSLSLNERKNSIKKESSSSLSKKKVKIATSVDEKIKDNGKLSKIITNKYDPFYDYEIGDEFIHEKWKEKGKVTEKFDTNSGTNIIVVDFKSSGRKKLVCNLKK